LFAATTAVNVSNLVFHVVVSRMLGPKAYGGLGALIGVVMVLQVGMVALQTAVTLDVAGNRGTGGGPDGTVCIGPLLRRLTVLAGIGFLAIAAASPWLKGFFRLASPVPTILLGAILLPVLTGLVPKGVLIGKLCFRPVAVALVAGAIARPLLGVLFVLAGLGIGGAVAATVASELVTTVFLLLPLRRAIRAHDGIVPMELKFAQAGPAIVAFTGFWLFVTLDTILARHYLPPVESGYYAAAASTARTVLFLPSAVVLVALPSFASPVRGEAQRALGHSLVAVGALGMAAATCILLAPRLIVRVLFGQQYLASTAVVGILATSSAGVGLISILINYYLARRSPLAQGPWVGVAALAVAVAAFHSSLTSVAVVVLVAVAAVLALLLVGFFAHRSTFDGSDVESTARLSALAQTTTSPASPDTDAGHHRAGIIT